MARGLKSQMHYTIVFYIKELSDYPENHRKSFEIMMVMLWQMIVPRMDLACSQEIPAGGKVFDVQRRCWEHYWKARRKHYRVAEQECSPPATK